MFASSNLKAINHPTHVFDFLDQGHDELTSKHVFTLLSFLQEPLPGTGHYLSITYDLLEPSIFVTLLDVATLVKQFCDSPCCHKVQVSSTCHSPHLV